MNQELLNDEMAKVTAVRYIEAKFNPLKSDSYFTFYYVVVGQDLSHQPNSIYAEGLPEHILLVNDDKTAKESFYKNTESQKQYLLKVKVDKENSALKASVIVPWQQGNSFNVNH